VSGSPAAAGRVSEVRHRVNYSETDQMGVAYHAQYLVWLDMARTEHLREGGLSYREIESRGFRLAVGEVHVRYLRSARFDDQIRVRCWVREARSRRVTFGYAVELVEAGGAGSAAPGELLLTGTTALFVLDPSMQLSRLPADALGILGEAPDPVRL
jgi:acyl-CoA thioester hydrolase